MAYFAKLTDGIVESVISINNSVIGEPSIPFPETEQIGIDFITKILGLDGDWKQTSYNSSFRKNYAGIGFSYDYELDAFVPPQPFPSWTLDTEKCKWIPPIPHPNDGNYYVWDEETISWKEITNDPN